MEEEEESISYHKPEPEPIPVCKCLLSAEPSEQIVISARKQQILTTVARTNAYLRERRIEDLFRFLVTKLLADASPSPVAYLEKLLDDCMLFRAGHGVAPVLYEDRHLEAIVKSFDPGQRGWLSAGQVRRAYTTLGLTPQQVIEDRMPCDVVLNNLKKDQEKELFNLLSAGMEKEEENNELSKSNSTT